MRLVYILPALGGQGGKGRQFVEETSGRLQGGFIRFMQIRRFYRSFGCARENKLIILRSSTKKTL
jgi:hypothetical protein